MSMKMVDSFRGKSENKAKGAAIVKLAPKTITTSQKDKSENTRNGVESVKIMKAGTRSGNQGGQLLPGIPDDITLEIISPKLSLGDLRLLSSVSRDWAKAIQGGLVYDARVRTQSTQTFVVIHNKTCPNNGHSGRTSPTLAVILLYSMRDGSWDKLPRPPGLDRKQFECVSLDGKLYILGGFMWVENGGNEVYVLEPAGARKWKQCASMLEPRVSFNAVVKDGKIYVFGGTGFPKPTFGCEVYDPKVDAWSSIAPKPKRDYFWMSKVAAIGEELIVYDPLILLDKTGTVDVYNPIEDRWRLIDPFGTNRLESYIFAAKGRFHAITEENPLSISFFDMDDQSWKQLQPYKDINPFYSLYPRTIVAVDDELIAEGNDSGYSSNFLRSRGFGQEQTQTVWEHISIPYVDMHISCCIQV